MGAIERARPPQSVCEPFFFSGGDTRVARLAAMHVTIEYCVV